MGYSIQERSSLKVLHLYSDWRWTGPAEPVLQICRGLKERGHDVKIAFRKDPVKTENLTIEKKVKEEGIEGVTRFSLDRNIGLINTLKDLIYLPVYLKKERFHIVHMHLSHDHAIGTICSMFLGKKRPVLVRTFHKRVPMKKNLFNRWLLRHTDGFLFFTEGFRREYIERFGLDPERTAIQRMTIDLERFNPEKRFRDMRKEFCIPEDAVVIGTVARFQRYRRMDWFLKAAKLILEERSDVYFLLVGRSSKINETVIGPVKRLGIERNVILAGYRREDYVDTINCMDIFTLLMPGSDGTARALREAMAMGKACVVSDFGMLPEIVKDSAIVVKDVISLKEAWKRLIENEEERRSFGKKAREYALRNFLIEDAAKSLEEFYLKLLKAYNMDQHQ